MACAIVVGVYSVSISLDQGGSFGYVPPTVTIGEVSFSFGTGSYDSEVIEHANGYTYVMPKGEDVVADADYSTTVTSTTKYTSVTLDGVPIYCPVVVSDCSDNKTTYTDGDDWRQFFPVFKDVVTIKDGDAIYDETTTTKPNTLTAVARLNSTSTSNVTAVENIYDVDKRYIIFSLAAIAAPEHLPGEPLIPTNSDDAEYSDSGVTYLVYASELRTSASEHCIYVKYEFKTHDGKIYNYYVCYYIAKRGTSCITAETLITLADGSQKMAKDLTGDEQLLTLNHTTGKLEATKIAYIVNHGEYANFKITKLNFSNGSSVEMYAEHVFYDVTLNKYVAINTNPEQYVGHEFIALAGTSMQTVTLESVTYETKYTSLYEVVTYQHLTCFTENILSTSAYLDKLLNIFEIEQDTYAYNSQKVAEDIQTYGTYAYEDFKDLISEEAFELYNAKYLKIAVGKGYITWQDILNLIDIYFNVDVKPLN